MAKSHKNNQVFRGYSDWYVPAKEELKILYQNLYYVAKNVNYYIHQLEVKIWSSTSRYSALGATNEAFLVNFFTGEVELAPKSDLHDVILIRSF